MEGTLFKWTNYYNGWQPRYFRLDETGVLSYYKSKELIDQGSKGSCLVLACDLKVHPTDPFRFDLIIPGEQFFSLKAKTQSERQQWLLVIGSFKSKGKKSTTHQRSNSNLQGNPIDQEFKMKIQELHLYQTVLTQGIHNLKSSVHHRPIVDIKELDQSRTMISVTSDALIQTLDELIKLANGTSSSSSSSIRSNSCEDEENPSSSIVQSNRRENLSGEKRFQTFFSAMSSKFSPFVSLNFNEIHAELFLTTCEEYFSFFDKFPSPTLIPLRSEIQSHLSKLRKKISTDRTKFQRLSSIIDDEILSEKSKEKNSATDALLWLTRNLHFLSDFFEEFGKGNVTVEEAMNNAYGKTLRPFHGWITRGIFSIAFRSVPYNEDFLRSLSLQTNSFEEDSFQKQINDEMIEHSREMKILVHKIFQYYHHHQIYSEDVIG